MSIYGTMRTSVSGMAAQSDRLSTIGDNVANVGTTGYKRVSTEFSTLLHQAVGTIYESGAVETTVRHLNEEQGTFNYTSSASDLAVNGRGFFLVESPGSGVAMTRAGAFTPNAAGELVNAAGGKLLGYNIEAGRGSAVVNGTAGLEPVKMSQLAIRAVPSDAGSLAANLPADASIVAPANLPSANGAAATYSARTSLVSFDSLGKEVTLDLYFAKTAPNAWEVSVFDRSAAAGTNSFPYASGPLVTTALNFNPTTGRLTGSPAALSVPIPGGVTAAIDLSDLSQFAGDFSIADAKINGTPAVPVKAFEMSEDGILSAVYANGSRAALYQVPLGYVNSPDNLTTVSGNMFLPSARSGDLQLGFADQGGLGGVVSGALEQSKVDIASEMTAMIEAQRNYTANSRVFQTGADLAEVAVNLRS